MLQDTKSSNITSEPLAAETWPCNLVESMRCSQHLNAVPKKPLAVEFGALAFAALSLGTLLVYISHAKHSFLMPNQKFLGLGCFSRANLQELCRKSWLE
jgi:hypothetical protein